MEIENITHEELDKALERWSKYASCSGRRRISKCNFSLETKTKRLLEIVGVVLDEQEREFKCKIKLAYRRDKTRLREYLYKLDKVQKLDLSEMTLREIVDFDLMKYF
ncbi:MAG: hypothetical protein ACRC7S_13160 [Cetobacterium sp.]|uniref:hypothetical protein n=1 Tax=uncultured Cetobacterium sp. TaxID=527638 RepID=UPI002601F7C1|nr:hypothetical protein [uncultured Cetobacterium sp.]